MDADYIAKVNYLPIGFLSHLKGLYGIKSNLVDFQIANVAGLISTAMTIERQSYGAADIVREASQDSPTPVHRLRPSVMFGSAFGFYLQAVGNTAHTDVEGTASRRRGHSTVQAYRVVYDSILKTFSVNGPTIGRKSLPEEGLTKLQCQNRCAFYQEARRRWSAGTS